MHEESNVDTDIFTWPDGPDIRNFKSDSARVQVDVGALSDPGKVRANNEDHFLVARFDRSMQTLLTNLPPGYIPEHYGEIAYGMLVADGMGGQAAGEVASRLAVSVLVDLVLQTPDWILRLDDQSLQEVRKRMERRFQQVQEALRGQAREDPSLAGMGTTMTLACTLGADLLLMHAGDSRAYLLRQDKLHRLTCDHTVAQSLADAGVISPQDVATHPLRHVLTNVLGGRAGRVRVDWSELRLLDGDQVLLCTDGLTDMVSHETIVEVLQSGGTAADACRALVDHALDAGGKDNISVVLGRFRIKEDGK
jgi:serine/threonine protein phosphatase PrpC